MSDDAATRQVAWVVGAGPGLGRAVAARFAAAGFDVAVSSRDATKLAELAAEVPRCRAYPCDSADARSVASAIEAIEADLGAPTVAVFNTGAFVRGSVLEMDPAEFERCWRVGCLGGFLVAQQAARRMVVRGAGTVIFTGATASLRGSAMFAALAVPKWGLRALAQSMARELGPRGVHVAHVVVDGAIRSERSLGFMADKGPDATLAPEAIAEQYFQLHQQERSAWTLELDLRPWVEKF